MIRVLKAMETVISLQKKKSGIWMKWSNFTICSQQAHCFCLDYMMKTGIRGADGNWVGGA